MRTPRRTDLPLDAPVRLGEVIAGKYRVERVIGRGGMGFVVAAIHLHLGERVAIKFLLPGRVVRAGAFDRFLREGRAAARIRSEHVARVYDAGVLPTGEPYLVLEHLDGIDLLTLLRRRGKLPIETAVTYVLQICEALAEAHALGIVHRDLKPGNLFLTRRRDGSRLIKIIDFGISKITSPAASSTDESALTESSDAFGTPHYMAPEQMRSTRDVDARADIWSLGAVLYSMLAGAPPFPGETIVGVYDRIREGAPLLRAARPDAPSRLEEIVLGCLRIEPAERYADVGELAVALAEVAPPEGRASAERAVRISQGLPAVEDSLDGEHTLVDDSEIPPSGKETLGSSPAIGGAPPGSAPASKPAVTEGTQDPSWDRAPSTAPRASKPPAVPTATSPEAADPEPRTAPQATIDAPEPKASPRRPPRHASIDRTIRGALVTVGFLALVTVGLIVAIREVLLPRATPTSSSATPRPTETSTAALRPSVAVPAPPPADASIATSVSAPPSQRVVAPRLPRAGESRGAAAPAAATAGAAATPARPRDPVLAETPD